MLVVHHLNNSRSQRILWMLEELGAEYRIETYQRDSKTNLAPEALKKVHPLGKSPVLTDGELAIAESGAIIDYLARRFDEPTLIPAPDTPEFLKYTYWLHFAEGTLMPPMVAKIVFDNVRKKTKFPIKILAGKIADTIMASYYGPIIKSSLKYVDEHLADNTWFAGDELTGADVQMSFPLEAAVAGGVAKGYVNIQRFVKQVHSREAYKRALQKGGEYNYAS
ncbi:glutathione S-transferase family protein [Aestuariibacter salexigens]|uniref:glutathione S-transferase family protein n=1 Tax=Aestuariibacter salexigens TaxID=226010 RepID=UPI000411DC09|nr:glutathione S-transferase [Aestuariibacter salexigens]